jgi:hypothetical protein
MIGSSTYLLASGRGEGWLAGFATAKTASTPSPLAQPNRHEEPLKGQ